MNSDEQDLAATEVEWPETSDLPDFGTESVIPGTLYIVGTPIGNLSDLSPRAAGILAGVDIVAAEDTRHTLRLLTHLGLRKRLASYHEHNWQIRGPILLNMLREGRSVALVSDAGMPCISDPGSEMVRLCAENNLPVTVIPGPCAAIVGLAGSGLLTERFVFEGFLPASGKERKTRLGILAGEDRTVVLYEAPHRLRRTLDDLAAAGMAGRQLTACRELTKRHEEYLRLSVSGMVDYYAGHDPRGEYVLIMEGAGAFGRRCPDAAQPSSGCDSAGSLEEQARILLRSLLHGGMSVKDATRRCAAETGLKKHDLYQLAIDLQRADEDNDTAGDAGSGLPPEV